METTDNNQFVLPVYELPEFPDSSPAVHKYHLEQWKKNNPAPEIYYFRSDKKGVFEISVRAVKDSKQGGVITYVKTGRKVDSRHYYFEGEPFDVQFEEGSSSCMRSYHGSGVGDLWAYSYFYSFDKDEIVRMHKEEKERIENKYFRVSEEDYLKAKEIVQKYESQNSDK